jgi:hypothetical protein
MPKHDRRLLLHLLGFIAAIPLVLAGAIAAPFIAVMSR